MPRHRRPRVRLRTPCMSDRRVFAQSGALAEDVRIQFQDLYSELIADEARNQLICDDVLEAIREGRSPLVLTERNEHLDYLAERFVARRLII